MLPAVALTAVTPAPWDSAGHRAVAPYPARPPRGSCVAAAPPSLVLLSHDRVSFL